MRAKGQSDLLSGAIKALPLPPPVTVPTLARPELILKTFARNINGHDEQTIAAVTQ